MVNYWVVWVFLFPLEGVLNPIHPGRGGEDAHV